MRTPYRSFPKESRREKSRRDEHETDDRRDEPTVEHESGFRDPEEGEGGVESARMPGMVGREQRGGRQRRAGRAGTYTPG